MAKLTDLRKLLDKANLPLPAARGEGRGEGRAQSIHPSPANRNHRTGGIKRVIAATKHSGRDVDLSVAFADVRRLPPGTQAKHSRHAPSPLPLQRIADERDALIASKYGAEPAPHSWDIGQELEGEQTFLRRGLGSDVLTKLRRGHWSVQSELDLHGLTSVDARDTLADFIADARQRGYRCVRVIHGKGLTSPNREPVLKGKVRKWLAQWGDVLAYTEAPRHAGGGGAVLILIRGK